MNAVVLAMIMPLIVNVDHRQTTSLNGTWNIIVDPVERGYYRLSSGRINDYGYFRDAKPAGKGDRTEYDFDSAEMLYVPGDWNSQSDKLDYYEGNIWYRRKFDYNLAEGKRLFIHFGAVNYEAMVWLNGEKLGEHRGGFTPFNFEITRLVKPGTNSLVVKVDNRRREDGIPGRFIGWWIYGGLLRDVTLIETPQTFIRDYFVQLKKGSSDTIAGWVQLDGQNLAQTVTLEIPQINLKHAGTADEKGYFAFECKAEGLSLWSPENPQLYDVIVQSEKDRVPDRIGFRTLETRGTQILLNGKPIFLRGISVHDEIAVQRGRVTSRGDALRIVNDALELGCNFIRLAHYPHNEHTLRVADEKGLLVWSEIPVYWAIQFENPQTYELAEQMLTEMITRDKNRACVAFWSMMNETQFTDARMEFLRKLIAKTRQMDDTRLIAAATYPHRLKNGNYTVKDPIMEDLDVIGCNQYIGWYIGNPPDAALIAWEKPIDKPVIFSELGGAALAGYYADDETAWSEEFQETIYRSQVEMIKRVDFLAGLSPWALYDFREPNRGLLKEQDKHNRKGIISNRGQYKKAYYVLQDFYHQLVEMN